MERLKADIRSGMPKKEALTRFCARGGDEKAGTRYLASIPDREEAERYSKLNFVLISAYSIYTFLNLINLLPLLVELGWWDTLYYVFFGLLAPCSLVWILCNQQALGYLLLIVFLLKGTVDLLQFYQTQAVWVLVGILVNALLLFYVVYLKTKLFPFQNLFNTRKNQRGVFVFQKSSIDAR